MPGTIPNEGEQTILDNALKTTTPEALYLRLFSNNATLANSNTAASFTECAVAGYAQKSLTRAGWNAAVAGSPSSSTYGTAQTFSFTGTGTVYGYYLVGQTSGKVYGAETLYPSGQAVASGDSISVTPKITFGSSTND